MSRINSVAAAFDVAAAETGDRRGNSRLRVCAPPVAVQSRRWTPTEDVFLRSNLGRLSEEEIGRALKRSPTAVHIRWTRDLHLQAPSKRDDTISAEGIATGIGMDGHSVHKLIDRGILPGRRMPGPRPYRLVDRRVLAQWLLDPAHWAYVDPARVGELRPHGKRAISAGYDFAYWEDLRELVLAARRRWKDDWLTPGQVAAMFKLRRGYVNKAIRKGALPATRWGNWRIRRSAIPKGQTLNFRGDWVKAKKKGEV